MFMILRTDFEHFVIIVLSLPNLHSLRMYVLRVLFQLKPIRRR